jgi:hypothetical protein
MIFMSKKSLARSRTTLPGWISNRRLPCFENPHAETEVWRTAHEQARHLLDIILGHYGTVMQA